MKEWMKTREVAHCLIMRICFETFLKHWDLGKEIDQGFTPFRGANKQVLVIMEWCWIAGVYFIKKRTDMFA